MQRWPRSHLERPRGLVVNHQNLVMNELQPSVTEYLSASSNEYSHYRCELSDIRVVV